MRLMVAVLAVLAALMTWSDMFAAFLEFVWDTSGPHLRGESGARARGAQCSPRKG